MYLIPLSSSFRFLFYFTAACITFKRRVVAVKRLLVLHHSADYVFVSSWITEPILGANVHWKSRRGTYTASQTTLLNIITKTCLFKYTENFSTKKWKNSDKKFWYFSYFCSKHRLWVLVRTASNLCYRAEIRKIMYTPVNPSFTI